MIQSFQCPGCGNLNSIGEPACTGCGQSFAYNCPVCGNQINNRCAVCPSCQTLFNWSRGSAQSYQEDFQAMRTARGFIQGTPPSQTDRNFQDNTRGPGPIQQPEAAARPSRATQKEHPQKTAAGITSRPMFWVSLMIACAILIALLLFIDRILTLR